MKGGYKIIDLRGENLTADAVTIPGAYESIEENYYKPLLLSGITIDGTERADVFTAATVDAGNYVLAAYGGIITITDENAVTYIKNS